MIVEAFTGAATPQRPVRRIPNSRVAIALIRTGRRTLSGVQMPDSISTVVLVHVAAVGIVIALLGMASVHDVATRTIPDMASLGLLLMGIAWRAADGDAPAALGASVVVLLL